MVIDHSEFERVLVDCINDFRLAAHTLEVCQRRHCTFSRTHARTHTHKTHTPTHIHLHIKIQIQIQSFLFVFSVRGAETVL